MDRKTTILLIGLIISIIFHALTAWFDVIAPNEGTGVYRIDSLTGRIWVCGVTGEGARCVGPLEERELPGR